MHVLVTFIKQNTEGLREENYQASTIIHDMRDTHSVSFVTLWMANTMELFNVFPHLCVGVSHIMNNDF